MKECGNQFKIGRAGTSLTQESAAEALLVSPRSLQDYENGRATPGPGMAARSVKLYRRRIIAYWYMHKTMPELAEFLPEPKEIQTTGDAYLEIDKGIEEFEGMLSKLKRGVFCHAEISAKAKSVMDTAASVYVHFNGGDRIA